MPAPTLGDLIDILHALGRQLHKDHLLDHIVGNRNVFGDSSEVWELREGLTKTYDNGRGRASHPYGNRLRARKVYSTGHVHSTLNNHPYLEEAIYLGYDGGGNFIWFWLVQHCDHSNTKGPVYCYDLMSVGARMAFENPDTPRGKYFGLSILQSLGKILSDEVKERRHRLTKLEAGSTTISNMVERFSSTLSEPRTSGDDIEG